MSAESISTIDADELAKAIVARIPRVPLASTLWTAEECAGYLKLESRTFAETCALPDFPKPTRVTAASGNRGPTNKRWFAGDVIDWARGRQG